MCCAQNYTWIRRRIRNAYEGYNHKTQGHSTYLILRINWNIRECPHLPPSHYKAKKHQVKIEIEIMK